MGRQHFTNKNTLWDYDPCRHIFELADCVARRVFGLLYRRFYGSTSLKQLYLSLVRPQLEYACQVWDPHLAGDKKATESVQQFALKLATAKWDKNYSELLDLAELKL